MNPIRDDIRWDGISLQRLESEFLIVDVAPEVGGRIVSVIEKRSGYEFLWRNQTLRLQRLPSGSEYDPHFYGGIDELLPNDIPEKIDAVDCPDHGELWTTPLHSILDGDRLILQGELPLFGLNYERRMKLREDRPFIDFSYRLSNRTRNDRHFLWKLHAALAVAARDIIDCPARKGQVVDPAWSRYSSLIPFAWPRIEGQAANIVPDKNGTVDFFYLFDLDEGRIAWKRLSSGLEFAYHFDTHVFPFCWLFASYGGFNDHYTVILEPCTTLPISVRDAVAHGWCSCLKPGESLETEVSIYAGPIRR